LESDRKNQILE